MEPGVLFSPRRKPLDRVFLLSFFLLLNVYTSNNNVLIKIIPFYFLLVLPVVILQERI